ERVLKYRFFKSGAAFTTALILGLPVMAFSCGTPVGPIMEKNEKMAEEAKSQEAAAAIGVTLSSDKTVYQPGETIRFQVVAKNNSQKELPLTLPSGQTFDVTVKSPDGG